MLIPHGEYAVGWRPVSPGPCGLQENVQGYDFTHRDLPHLYTYANFPTDLM